ncbi:lamin tail domain-containing protein, partial [Akkermansiaceae bacterium]|nr:lamin tail domain-containing protein [Akkermansiaceae bacterium]
MLSNPFSFLALALLGITSPLVAQSVIISEFMASNAETLNDEDGDSEDWLELHNQGGSPLNLSGWYLTDDATDLTKWTIPDLTLSTGELLLVFASNKDRNDPASQLHTNFKLSAGGEYLALVRPDGVTIEHDYGTAYPQQVTDISYGLQQSTSNVSLLSAGASGDVIHPVNAEEILADKERRSVEGERNIDECFIVIVEVGGIGLEVQLVGRRVERFGNDLRVAIEVGYEAIIILHV